MMINVKQEILISLSRVVTHMQDHSVIAIEISSTKFDMILLRLYTGMGLAREQITGKHILA